MIVALAGRRVDPPNADVPRFPVANAAMVRERIRAELAARDASVLVSSAACGSDLLALDAAGELGVRRIVVLPFSEDQFRATSVVDRGGEWGVMFDRIMREISAGDLRLLNRTDEGDAAYVAANEAILETASDVARESGATDGVVAVIAWNGKSRGPRDLTEAFMTAAQRRGMKVTQILTV